MLGLTLRRFEPRIPIPTKIGGGHSIYSATLSFEYDLVLFKTLFKTHYYLNPAPIISECVECQIRMWCVIVSLSLHIFGYKNGLYCVPCRHFRETLNIALPWMAISHWVPRKNGGLHSVQPFSIERTALIGWNRHPFWSQYGSFLLPPP